MTGSDKEILRLREEYARRAAEGSGDERYSLSNPSYRWILADRRRAIVDILKRQKITDLSKMRILEVGCGAGGVIDELIELGADPASSFGVDLLQDRLREANKRLPACYWISADGQSLPFEPDSFDIVLQFTAFSSILGRSTQETMAAEILRVLKPGQGVLWYDFIWNPLNRQTRGIPLAQIKQLFPGTQITSRRITLAPPLCRFLIPRFSWLPNALTRFAFLNSHLLAWIQKPG